MRSHRWPRRYGVPAPGETPRRLRPRRHRDGQRRRTIRGIDRTLEYAEYRRGGSRSRSDRGASGRMAAAAEIVEGMGADIVDVNMGCPCRDAKHNAVQPDARAGSCRISDCGDDEGREHSCDGQDASGLGRRRAECAGPREDGRGRRRGGHRRARPHGGAELQRIGRLGSGRAHRRRPCHSGVRQW